GRRAGALKRSLDLELEPVVGALEAVGEWQLVRAVRDEEALGARGHEGGERLVDVEVPARLAVELAPLERRLAEEEVGVAREVGELPPGSAGARVRARPPAGPAPD